jgi:hypothetical protein
VDEPTNTGYEAIFFVVGRGGRGIFKTRIVHGNKQTETTYHRQS